MDKKRGPGSGDEAKFAAGDAVGQAPEDSPAMSGGVLGRVRAIRGVTWEWKPGTEAFHGSARERQMGVIAQEVAAVFPEAVTEHPDSGYLMVDYAGLVGALIEAVKELADRVEELEARLGDGR